VGCYRSPEVISERQKGKNSEIKKSKKESRNQGQK
jgi:hypothetical protein